MSQPHRQHPRCPSPLRAGLISLAASLALFTLSASAAPPPLYASDAASDFSLSDLPGLREAGLDLSFWSWLSYAASNQEHDSTSWGSEFELDATQTFFDHRLSLAADLEFVDYDDEMRGSAEQLFASLLLDRDNGTVLTVGKFNSPFGVEPRDFWDRLTGTPSLLFRAQPQDLRGVMLTAPLGTTGVVLRPFLVSGFHDDDAIAGQPSAGLMAEYHPTRALSLAITNWIGPGLASEDDEKEYSSSSSSEYAYSNSVFELTNAWWGPQFKAARSGRLYFLDLQATWNPRPDLTLAAEYLLASSRVGSDTLFWDGAMAMADYQFDDHFHVFGMWSFLDDRDGAVTGVAQQRHELSTGVGYRVNRHLEFRTEYRHDFSSKTDGVDSVSFNVTFGV